MDSLLRTSSKASKSGLQSLQQSSTLEPGIHLVEGGEGMEDLEEEKGVLGDLEEREDMEVQ